MSRADAVDLLEPDPSWGLTSARVDVGGGRALRVLRGGEGGPAVVFVSGMLAGASEWVAVQRRVATEVSTVSYDRAGIGGSDKDPEVPDLARFASDLRALLDALGLAEPVVLVAHSWGGPISRFFARENPDRVAAVVLVDASVSEALPVRELRLAARSTRLMVRLRRAGLHRVLLGRVLRDRLGGLDDAEKAFFLHDMLADRTLVTGAREQASLLAGDRQVLVGLQASGLPPVPVTAVVATVVERGAARSRQATLEVTERELAAHPGPTRYVPANRSGHMVPQQEPGLVVDEVLRLVAGLRAA